jgi:hypothetical protein
MAAMLDDITQEVNEKYFVNVLQHGGENVTCNRRIVCVFAIGTASYESMSNEVLRIT